MTNTNSSLLDALEEYIEFLGKNISDNAVFLEMHNMGVSQKTMDKGIELREKIKLLKEQHDSFIQSQAKGGKEDNEERDLFAMSFLVFALTDPRAIALQRTKGGIAAILSLYKDRPYLDMDTSKQ